MGKEEYLIDIKTHRTKLKKVHFYDIDISDELVDQLDDESLEIFSKIEDNYEITDFTNKDIEISFTRKYSFKPEVIFIFEIEISIFYDINKKDKDISLDNLKQEVEERKVQLLMPATSKASLLLGNITNIDTDSPPVITFPYISK